MLGTDYMHSFLISENGIVIPSHVLEYFNFMFYFVLFLKCFYVHMRDSEMRSSLSQE